MTPRPTNSLEAPQDLPFLAAISWFDVEYRQLNALDMLRRYEDGWRHLGVLGEPSDEEWGFIQALIKQYGSVIRVPD